MPADATISSLSTEYLQVPVQASLNGTPYNPTGDPVEFAFVTGSGYPVTWYPGSWVTTVQSIYLAQCLIGPQNGGVVLAPGTYTVWVQITDFPEIPVQPTGSLQIT